MRMEKHVYLKKNIYMNGLNMGLSQRAKLEKTVHNVETHRLSDKEKFTNSAVSKEGHADSVLWHKRPITIDFLEKCATVNSALY